MGGGGADHGGGNDSVQIVLFGVATIVGVVIVQYLADMLEVCPRARAPVPCARPACLAPTRKTCGVSAVLPPFPVEGGPGYADGMLYARDWPGTTPEPHA